MPDIQSQRECSDFCVSEKKVSSLSVQRCWAALENYWNGAILDSIEATVQWASNMTWKGIAPIVHRMEATYEKGIKVLSDELEQLQVKPLANGTYTILASNREANEPGLYSVVVETDPNPLQPRFYSRALAIAAISEGRSVSSQMTIAISANVSG